MINALVQYGEKLYERGDFDEASAVFNHVLIYDHHQPQALEYLKDMGHAQQVFHPFVPKQNIIMINRSDKHIINMVDVSNTQSLEGAIEAKKRVIEQLQTQITQMRANIASVTNLGVSR